MRYAPPTPNSEVARLRLQSLRVVQKLKTPGEVVRELGAMQAQDYPASLWAIGVRTKAATLADVAAAVERREIARTWPMRGTLHWVPAEDLRWMVALMAPRATAKAAARRRQLEIDAEALSKARKLIERALRGGSSMTRPEAYELFRKGGLKPDGQRGIHLLSLLAHEATLCFGPHRGRQPAFVLAEEWLPKGPSLSGDEAVAELARRYFRSHGPATAHDFAWWTGLTVTDARKALDAVRDGFESMTSDGKEYWFAPRRRTEPDLDSVHLLPGFDEYILGYTDRTAVLSSAQAKRLTPGKNGMFLASIVAGTGEVLGAWRRSVGKAGVTVTPEMFDDSALPDGFGAAARRYADFLALELRG